MRVNTQLLDDYITKSGLKISFILEQLGISAQAFNKKRNNKIPFRVAETYVLCALLHIPEKEKNKVFFKKEVE